MTTSIESTCPVCHTVHPVEVEGEIPEGLERMAEHLVCEKCAARRQPVKKPEPKPARPTRCPYRDD